MRVALATVILALAAGSSPSAVHFRVFADTGLRLADIVWTGERFLYVENTTNAVYEAGPAGTPVRAFAKMPDQVEETRCRVSPGAHGFAPGDVYCHSPDNKIYRISPDGTGVTIFATLPEPETRTAPSNSTPSATSASPWSRRPAAPAARRGEVEASTRSTRTAPSAASANTTARAAPTRSRSPRGFGTAAGNVLLTVDAGRSGSLLAMDASGRTQTIAELPDGPNPIAAVPRYRLRTDPPSAGLYVTDTNSRQVLFAPAANFRRYAGGIVVGSELKAIFWVVLPRRSGFVRRLLHTNLQGAHNLEGAAYIG